MAFLPVNTIALTRGTAQGFDVWLAANHPGITLCRGSGDNRLEIGPTGVSALATINENYTVAGTHTADQYAKMRLVSWSGSGAMSCGVRTSSAGASVNGVFCTVNISGTPYVYVRQIIAGSVSAPSEQFPAIAGFGPGNDLLIGVVGQDLLIYRDTTLVTTLSAYVTNGALAGGNPNFGAQGFSSEVVFAGLETGDIGTGGGGGLAMPPRRRTSHRSLINL